ncbi:hypothetical protein PC123_g26863 [Phytophthora cactorum]|nr:hypothetical protein PC123_g26863 [Phytophthora cactorum]
MHHGANEDMVAEDGEDADAAVDHATIENAAVDMQETGDNAVGNMEVTSGTVVNDVVVGTEDGHAQHEHTRHQHANEVRATPTRTVVLLVSIEAISIRVHKEDFVSLLKVSSRLPGQDGVYCCVYGLFVCGCSHVSCCPRCCHRDGCPGRDEGSGSPPRH